MQGGCESNPGVTHLEDHRPKDIATGCSDRHDESIHPVDLLPPQQRTVAKAQSRVKAKGDQNTQFASRLLEQLGDLIDGLIDFALYL